jgi:hypothetical protein
LNYAPYEAADFSQGAKGFEPLSQALFKPAIAPMQMYIFFIYLQYRNGCNIEAIFILRIMMTTDEIRSYK